MEWFIDFYPILVFPTMAYSIFTMLCSTYHIARAMGFEGALASIAWVNSWIYICLFDACLLPLSLWCTIIVVIDVLF
jgi:hypothetical protein